MYMWYVCTYICSTYISVNQQLVPMYGYVCMWNACVLHIYIYVCGYI